MSDVLVRPARDDEAVAAGAVTVAAYDADGHLTRTDGSSDTDYAAFLARAGERARRGVLLVAVDDDGTVLGTVTWCPPGSDLRELTTADDRAELRTLAVAPTARGRGVGAALLDHCLALAREAGLVEVLLCSLPEMLPAHHLYGSRGFVRRPALDWSPHAGVRLWAFSLQLPVVGWEGAGGEPPAAAHPSPEGP